MYISQSHSCTQSFYDYLQCKTSASPRNLLGQIPCSALEAINSQLQTHTVHMLLLRPFFSKGMVYFASLSNCLPFPSGNSRRSREYIVPENTTYETRFPANPISHWFTINMCNKAGNQGQDGSLVGTHLCEKEIKQKGTCGSHAPC